MHDVKKIEIGSSAVCEIHLYGESSLVDGHRRLLIYYTRFRNSARHGEVEDEARVGYSSGQRGQTVNLLANAFQGSNPCPTTNKNL